MNFLFIRTIFTTSQDICDEKKECNDLKNVYQRSLKKTSCENEYGLLEKASEEVQNFFYFTRELIVDDVGVSDFRVSKIEESAHTVLSYINTFLQILLVKLWKQVLKSEDDNSFSDDLKDPLHLAKPIFSDFLISGFKNSSLLLSNKSHTSSFDSKNRSNILSTYGLIVSDLSALKSEYLSSLSNIPEE